LDVQCLVVVVKIDPSSHPFHSRTPFGRVTHDDRTALGVVFVNTHLHYVLLASNAELFVDLMLDRESVGIPSESALDMVAVGMSISSHNVLIFW
jgi:hypothetical protein